MDELLERLHGEGFDFSQVYTDDDGNEAVSVRCSQCSALVINGVACHETGCPNQRRMLAGWDDDGGYEDQIDDEE